MTLKKRPSGAAYIVLACLVWSFSGVLSKWSPWSAFSIIGSRALLTALVFGFTRKSFKPSFTRGNILGALGVI